jgi:hypothetical protein
MLCQSWHAIDPASADLISAAAHESSRRLLRDTSVRPLTSGKGSRVIQTLADVERTYMLEALRETNWTIGGRRGAAAPRGLAVNYFHISDAEVRHLPRIAQPAGKSANQLPHLRRRIDLSQAVGSVPNGSYSKMPAV